MLDIPFVNTQMTLIWNTVKDFITFFSVVRLWMKFNTFLAL